MPTRTDSDTAPAVVLMATLKVPLKPSGATTPGIATVTVPAMRPASPAGFSTNRPLPFVRWTPASVVPRCSATLVANTRTVFGGWVPAGAPGLS